MAVNRIKDFLPPDDSEGSDVGGSDGPCAGGPGPCGGCPQGHSWGDQENNFTLRRIRHPEGPYLFTLETRIGADRLIFGMNVSQAVHLAASVEALLEGIEDHGA